MADKDKSIRNLIKYKKDATTSQIVDHIMERLSHGATKSELIVELRLAFDVKKTQAEAMIDTCVDVAFRLEPEFVAEVAGQVRHSLGLTMQQIDEMIKRAKSDSVRQMLVKDKLHAIQALQKLLPSQIDITTSDEGRIKQILFDLHGIEEEEG